MLDVTSNFKWQTAFTIFCWVLPLCNCIAFGFETWCSQIFRNEHMTTDNIVNWRLQCHLVSVRSAPTAEKKWQLSHGQRNKQPRPLIRVVVQASATQYNAVFIRQRCLTLNCPPVWYHCMSKGSNKPICVKIGKESDNLWLINWCQTQLTSLQANGRDGRGLPVQDGGSGWM